MIEFKDLVFIVRNDLASVLTSSINLSQARYTFENGLTISVLQCDRKNHVIRAYGDLYEVGIINNSSSFPYVSEREIEALLVTLQKITKEQVENKIYSMLIQSTYNENL